MTTATTTETLATIARRIHALIIDRAQTHLMLGDAVDDRARANHEANLADIERQLTILRDMRACLEDDATPTAAPTLDVAATPTAAPAPAEPTTPKITASFAFGGTTHQGVEVVNPGGWFGKTWLMEIGGSYAPFFVVVEADSCTDAINELIDSKFGHQFILDPADFADYAVGTDNPTCSFFGNNGHPCDIGDLAIHGDDRDGYAMTYDVEGWDAPVAPKDLDAVLVNLGRRASYADDVKGPGKFEGNPSYVPYFWDMYLNGDGEEVGGGVLRFVVEDEDILIFPELGADTTEVFLVEDDNGFVNLVDGPGDDVDEDYNDDDEQDDDDDADTDADGPEDEDWVTTDHITFREVNGRGRVVVPDGADWRVVLEARMNADQLWPNVWLISDHGNVEMLSLTDDE